MSTVEKKVRLIRWRLEWLNFARRFVRLFLIALIILTLCLIALKFISLPWQFAVIARWLVAATVPLALLWAALTRTSLSGAAVTADQRLALRERLSTALAVGAPQTAMEQALMADAQTHASRLMAHRAFPMPLWRDLCFMPIPLIAMALVGLLVPRYDLFGEKKGETERPLSTPAQQELAKRLDTFQRELEQIQKAAPPVQTRELSAEMAKILRDLESSKTMSRAAVLKDLSSLYDRLAEKKADIEKKLSAAEKMNLFRFSDEARKIAEAMSKGSFDQASSVVARLTEKISKQELTDEQRRKLGAQLKELADALKDNPELSKALQDIANALKDGDLKAALEGLQLTAQQLQDLAETLKQMAQLDQLAGALQALRACEGGLCDCTSCTAAGCICAACWSKLVGEFQKGELGGFGSGMGGAPGRGAGGIAPIEEKPRPLQPTKARMKIDKGDVIGVIKAWGPQVKGEAEAKFEHVHFEYRQSAEDTLSRENIPLESRNLVRRYFDAIRPATAATSPDKNEPQRGKAANQR